MTNLKVAAESVQAIRDGRVADDYIDDLLDDWESMQSIIAALTAENETLTRELSTAREEVAALRSRLELAVQFVPAPEEMSGYDDPDCPVDVRELIDAARRLRADTKEPA